MQMNADQIRDDVKFAQHVRTALPGVVRENKITSPLASSESLPDHLAALA